MIAATADGGASQADGFPRAVPAFACHEFRPKQAEVCLCVFVINEDGKLQRQLEKTRPFADLVDVVVADGGSTDGSTDPATLQALSVNTLLVKTGPGKLGAKCAWPFPGRSIAAIKA